MNADPRTELKFKEAADSKSEPVRLVTAEIASSEEPGLNEVPPEIEPEESPLGDLPKSESSETILHAYTNRASFSSGSFSKADLTYSLSGHYPSEPSRSSILPDLKQLFNCAYFTAAALASADLVNSLNNHMLLAFTFLFVSFAIGAFVYSINQRVHISDFSVTLSRRTRRAIRAIALFIPIPIIAGAACVRMSDYQLDLANTAYDTALYSQAIDHLNLAIKLNPFNEGAYDAFSRVHYMQSEWDLAYEYGQKASSLDPKDSYAWSDQARPLHMMQRNAEAIVAAEKAVQLDPTNGQAFSTLAESYLEAGQYEMALYAAQKHSKIHTTEPYAFEVTANILRKLGRESEAAAALAESQRLAAPVQPTQVQP
ncbi:hypothetical protein BH10CYA1_BH10CYA1_57400 [soil metagenome]